MQKKKINNLFIILISFIFVLSSTTVVLATINDAYAVNLEDIFKKKEKNDYTSTYTVSYDNNGGVGFKEVDTITVDYKVNSKNEYDIKDTGYVFPSNPYQPPLFMKFKCWQANEKEYSPGNRIYKVHDSEVFQKHELTVKALYEMDWLMILIFSTIIILGLIIFLILFKMKFNKKFKLPVNITNSELLQLKKLLDNDIITKEEFEQKKKELLKL